MATIIKIKRTTGASAPSSLNQGEMAYVYDTASSNSGVGQPGRRLFIGDPSSPSNTPIEIGGEYFTNLLDHSHGVVTADSGVIVDSSKKVDEWNVDDITIDGNTITNNSLLNNLTFSNTSGCINFTGNQLICVTDPTSGQDAATKAYVDSQLTAQDLDLTADTGSASIDLDSETLNITGGTGLSTTVDNLTKQLTIDLDDTAVTPGSYGSTTAIPTFTVDQQGRLTAASTVNVATTLSTAAETGTGSVDLLSDTLSILAGEGINTVASGTNITISGENASDTNKGIASFSAADFDVTSGDVSLEDTVVKTVTTDSGAMTPASHSFSVLGGEGMDVTHTGSTITVTGEDATSSNKGIASFDSNDFDVTSGAVTLEDTVVKTISTDSGTLTPSTHGFTINGGEGMDVTHVGTTITVTGEDATSSNKGVASFDSTDFTVTSGAVAVNAITLGSSSLNPGATTTDIAGLTSLVVDNVNVDGSTITSTSGDLTLTATSGDIDVNSNKIVNVATPVNDTDAANKAYVDAARTGLDVKGSVKVATTANITLSGTQTIDGVALSVGDRVLVKNQTTASENGIYVVASGGWSRATDADENAEVTSGMFTFVEQGSVNSDTGFVLTTDGTITVGSTNLEFTLFSASGTLIAGDGLSKNGDTLEVNVANGLQIASDNVELASSVAGDGLTFSSGVIDVVGTTNRITVNANDIDIASTYVGQTSITTLGTITAGTWNADVINEVYGGTGQSSYTTGDILYSDGANSLAKLALGANGKILQSDGSNVTYGDIDGGTY